MNDHPKDEAETPMARALRMKKEAAAAKARPASGARSEFRRGAAGMASGASKPALRK